MLLVLEEEIEGNGAEQKEKEQVGEENVGEEEERLFALSIGPALLHLPDIVVEVLFVLQLLLRGFFSIQFFSQHQLLQLVLFFRKVLLQLDEFSAVQSVHLDTLAVIEIEFVVEEGVGS